jgi:SAM-dependent methyltransferase
VTIDDAIALIRPAVPDPGGTWADLGAGTGTFTRALAALLGPGGAVYALDRDARALAALAALAEARRVTEAAVVAVRGDLAALPALPALDGALLANALHFVPAAAQAGTLARVASQLRPGAPLVLVEYDGRAPSRWVPFPVSFARFTALAAEARLAPPARIGARPSAYGGTLYAAMGVVTARPRGDVEPRPVP